MNHYVIKKIMYIPTIICFIVWPSCAANKTPIFDPLFAQTAFKDAIMHCMKARSSAHMLLHHEGSTFDAHLLYDCMIGRVAQLSWAIDVINNSSQMYMHDDIAYLSTIIDDMAAEINNALKIDISYQKQEMSVLITTLKKKIEDLLQTS